MTDSARNRIYFAIIAVLVAIVVAMDQAAGSLRMSAVIRVWNGAAARAFGFAAEEAIGRSLDLIIPEHLRQAHWSGFRRAMQSGATRLGERPTMTRRLCGAASDSIEREPVCACDLALVAAITFDRRQLQHDQPTAIDPANVYS